MNESAQSPDARRDLLGTLEKLPAALAGRPRSSISLATWRCSFASEPSGCRRQRRFHSCRASSSSSGHVSPPGSSPSSPDSRATWRSGSLVVTKDPFLAKVYISEGGELVGVFNR